MSFIKSIAVTATAICATAAHADTIINFSNYSTPGTFVTFVFDNPVVESGYAFTQLTSTGEFIAAQTGSTDYYYGESSLANDAFSGLTELTRVGGGAFNFNSIDLAPLSHDWAQSGDVLFTGTLANGNTVSQTLYYGNTFTTNNVNFADVVKVDWSEPDNTFSYQSVYQFTNVNVAAVGSTPAVPEPAESLLLAAGVAALAGLSARRKTKLNGLNAGN